MTRSKLASLVKLITCLATAFLLVLVVIVICQCAKINSLSAKSASLDDQIAQNSITQAELEAGIDLRSSDEYVEQQARENLGMIEEDGETIYILS